MNHNDATRLPCLIEVLHRGNFGLSRGRILSSGLLAAAFTMIFISLTRLRIRSIRFLPLFLVHALRSVGQARKAPGFQIGELLNDRRWTFWTMTAWDSQESMRAFMTTGSHKKAMSHLLHWCDEASVAHWAQPEITLPSWTEAERKMRQIGRASKVLHPSPRHASLSFRPPRTTMTNTIRPRS
jgi:Domain of unknown function (DUF3291)